MERHLTEKQKILLRMAGMTAAVYLVFRYLIPLLIPFLIAMLLSVPIRPAARFFYKKAHIPIGLAAGLLLSLLLAAAGLFLFWVGKSALGQLALLCEQLPGLWSDCCDWLLACCGGIERGFCLEEGVVSGPLLRLAAFEEGSLGEKALAGLTGALMDGSFQGIRIAIRFLVGVFVTVGATLITTTQLEEIKRARDRSRFREEIVRVTEVLSRVGAAYGKTQAIILLITMALCVAVLTVLGNPYAVLLGILIGLFDALPIFGVGTVLGPWILICLIRREFRMAAGLALLYGACSLLREIFEARYMGGRIGLSALENLIAMYVGMQLFGLLGLFFGPIGWLLVKEAGKDGFSVKKD